MYSTIVLNNEYGSFLKSIAEIKLFRKKYPGYDEFWPKALYDFELRRKV